MMGYRKLRMGLAEEAYSFRVDWRSGVAEAAIAR